MTSSPTHKTRFRWMLASWFFAGCLSLHTNWAQTVVLSLRNGDRVSGRILSENSAEITVTNSVLGKIRIPVAQIERREKPSEGPAPASAAASALKTAGPSTPVPSAPNVPAAQTPPKPPPEKGPRHWSSELQVGSNLRFSTKDQQDYYLTAKSTYVKNSFRNIFDYSFAYGKTEGILSANRMTGSSKSELNLSQKWYVYNLAGAGFDEIRRIDVQYEVGPGMGYELIHSTNLNFVLKTELGLSYLDQFRSDNTRLRTYSARVAEIFVWKIWDQLIVDGRIEYFPNVERFEDYRLRAESNLRYPLFKSLSLNLTFIDLYDTTPAAGVTPNDLQIRSTLGLKF